LKGGQLKFEMSNKKNMNWGAEKKAAPYSMSLDKTIKN